MPQKAPRHHLQRPHLQRRGAKQNSASHWATRRPLDHSKATQTEMVRARNKIYRACQDNPAWHSAMREKKRQTEKEMGGQHPGMDGRDTGRAGGRVGRRVGGQAERQNSNLFSMSIYI